MVALNTQGRSAVGIKSSEKFYTEHKIKEKTLLHVELFYCVNKLFISLGREPWSSGYGRDSRDEGRGFDSRHLILDGQLSHIFCKNFNDVSL